MAVPRGAAPLPPVRQTGVQICYTMAPERIVDGVRCRTGRRGVAPRCAVLETALVAGPRPERLAGIAPASPVWKAGALLLS